MKILKPGRWLFKFTCKNCGALLEGEEGDLYTFQMGQTITVGLQLRRLRVPSQDG